MSPLDIGFDELRRRHRAVLLDAYGVLVDASGALAGAARAIESMRRDGQSFLIVTNDASRSRERAAARLEGLGLDVTPAHILSSGMLIEPALREAGDTVRSAVVLGTRDSVEYARAAGVEVVEPSIHEPADAVVIADEGGFDLLSVMDDVLSMIIESARRGRMTRLLLANPDLIYPSGNGSFGFTAGTLALMLEHALELVLGSSAPRFEHLGKPSPRIFNEAVKRVGTNDAVMIGDQLHTDIAGANAIGIASALLLGGVSHERAMNGFGEWTPTYVLQSL